MSDLVYPSSVPPEEFDAAVEALQRAIERIDTTEELARLTGQILLFAGKIAISNFGAGPALEIAKVIFADKEEIIKILELLGDEDE